MSYADEHKVPTFRIRQIDNTDPDFYRVMGPLLSRREVVEELGGPMWDDDGKQWWLAESDTGLLGVIALHQTRVCSFYVLPVSRNRSVGAALLNHVLRQASGVYDLHATATPASHRLFEVFGFEEVASRGSFVLMVKRAWMSDALAL